MKFNIIFSWHYDPCGIIAETRLKNKISPYAHVPKPEIEKFMNQTEWEMNTLGDSEQQPPSTSVSQTITPQVSAEKRPRKEVSLLVTEVSTKDFRVYRKNTKTNHTPERSRGEETQSTIAVEGENSPFFSSSHKMMSTSSSKNQVDTTLTTQPSQGSAGLSIF